ncbi:E3 ubiquitin-protein ligase RSL1-like [Andrographis paniculata]|uniref:E3 ubiquitin-protein ligase RSL1-like n=1 Tax=Andrographis paniculata TaxID=175694 RepID=UPI0021E762F7|nr:E3 ubiquitin-protein ligase RSL1-like [Andrographis paniculata]
MFTCEICAEEKLVSDFFRIQGCNHSYCTNCIAKFVATKVDQNTTSITCPSSACDVVLEPQNCRSIIAQKVFDRWSEALCEAMIPSPEKFYCPFKDCSSLLINDSGEFVVESECPVCNRLFCAQCKVPWHSEKTCEAFRRSGSGESSREDVMVKNLAKDLKWMRCSVCGFFIEKLYGCDHMKCRCGHAFCYNCGATLIAGHCNRCG